jgi:uncharacterized membrane protein
MEWLSYLLVVVSAFTHAYWNFILKRAKGGQVFIGLSKIAEIVFFILPFIYFITNDEISILNYWVFYIVGALLVIFNYIFLGQAYKRGDLSLIYPISRAGSLLFLPPLAYLFIGERIDGVGFVAIILIMFGLFAIQLQSFCSTEIKLVIANLRSSATVLALLAAFTAACYTLWDKHSISYLPPFIYFYAYTAIVGISYALFIFLKNPFSKIKTELAVHKYSILQVGFLNTSTYLLVLYSLQAGKASYVIALRQMSIAFGVFLGWKALKETFPFPRKIGITLLLMGCLLISLAR